MSRISMVEAEKVLDRASDFNGWLYCEACGGAIGGYHYVFHHRHAHGMGGGAGRPWMETAANLMLVHGDLRLNCHNLTEYSIHQNPERSERLFHIIRDDPALFPAPIVARDLLELRA